MIAPRGAAAIALALAPVNAAAEPGDGVYGRLDGDIEVQGALGFGLAGSQPVGVARAGATFVQAAGVYFLATDPFSAEAPPGARSLAPGIRLQPLFWARFAQDWQTGAGRLDLFIDSLAFECGAVWSWKEGAFDPEPGLELGLSLGVPLFADASGPFVGARIAGRWTAPDLRGAADAPGPQMFFAITIAWHQILRAHLVDARDTRAP